MSHPATVPEVIPGTASCCIVGSVPLTVMADAFGDNLFSVFDDDEQTSTSKNVPASLTTDIGYVEVVKSYLDLGFGTKQCLSDGTRK